LAREIASRVIPAITTTNSADVKNIKLVCVGIGTHDRSQEFAELTQFPLEYLYSDASNSLYDSLELVKSNPLQLMTDPRTPIAIARRFTEKRGGNLVEALRTWKPFIPPKLEQGLQQGGAFVFSGEQTVYGRKDPATGDHADLDTLLRLVVPSDSPYWSTL
jgi:hypothetical protein